MTSGNLLAALLGLIVLACLAVWVILYFVSLGRKAQRADTAESAVKEAADAQRIREDVSRLSDAELRQRLHDMARVMRDDDQDYPTRH